MKKRFILPLSNLEFNLIFYNVELVIRKENFYKHFWVSNSKCDVILGNLVPQLVFGNARILNLS